MPLFKIETQSKQPDTRPKARGRGPAPAQGSALPVVAFGAVLALLVIAAFAFWTLRQGGQTASDGGSDPVSAPMLGPINPDYPRETVVATVNGQSYTMAELEVAVRVAHVLGAMSGDTVPAYDIARRSAISRCACSSARSTSCS